MVTRAGCQHPNMLESIPHVSHTLISHKVMFCAPPKKKAYRRKDAVDENVFVNSPEKQHLKLSLCLTEFKALPALISISQTHQNKAGGRDTSQISDLRF